MEENKSLTPLNLVPLDTQTREIAQKILDEQDVDKVKDLTTIFNLNAQKRNVMRVIKMNDLLDKVTDKVMERFEKTPDNFSNDDLLRYMQVTETAIDRANKQLNLVDETPPIQLQQNNQINVSIVDSLDRDARERVADVVKSILKSGIVMSQPSETVILQEEVEVDGSTENTAE